MNRKSALVIGAAATLCVLLLLVGLALNRGAPADPDAPLYLLITVDGKPWEPIPLKEEGEYAVAQEETAAVNVVRVTKDSVWMESSTCKNQDCVKQGTVTRDNRGARLLGNQIICLPNKVTLQLCTQAELNATLSLD